MQVAIRSPERRVSERERAAAADVLARARGEGFLSADTLEQRLQAASAAKRRLELAALLSDLPETSALARARSWVRTALRPTPALAAPRVLTPPPGGGSGPFVIGRHTGADLCIDDATVSKHHADLRRTDDGWLLVDVGSRNGTRVNGWRIHEVELQQGDVVQIGNVVFVFDER